MSKSKKNKKEEELIYNEICNEINHHDVLSFKLGEQSLNDILSKTKKFEKRFFHYQRYNFKLEDICPELSFSDIEVKETKNKNDKNIENQNNNSKNDEEISKKFNNIISGKKNLTISEFLEDIMKEVNVFDILLEDEQSKLNVQNREQILNNDIKLKEEKRNQEKEIKILSPIEMINKIENDYNNILVQKIKSETETTELYPLDTYKKNNELKVQIISEQKKETQFFSLKQKMLIKEEQNTIGDSDIFNVFTIDKQYQEPGSIEPRYIYAGTKKGFIVKVLLNNRNNTKPEDIREVFDSEEGCINCIDIFENYMVTGHQNSSILFWENNKKFSKTKNDDIKKDNEIISIKIIKLHNKKKIEIIFSDYLGRVFYLKKTRGIFGGESKELIIDCNKCPTYKITFISGENNLSKTKKKRMLFCLTSSKGVTLIKLRPKPDAKDENKYILKFITSPIIGKIDSGIFDANFGIGYPPVDMQIGGKLSNIRDSISEIIVKGNQTGERLLLTVSYGDVINLYELKIPRTRDLKIQGVGHYINDKPIIYTCFLTNSFMAIITNDFYLKIINTFDFDKYEYTKRHAPSKNNLVIFENIELKQLIMMKQTNIYKYNEENNSFIDYHIYLNSIVPLNKSIVILGRVNLCQYTLLQWDAIIESFDREKQYEKMLWLAMIVFNNNRNFLTIQSQNRNEEFLINNKYQICSPIISKFLIQVVMKEIDKKNFIPMRMFIEFCIGAELYECLYESIFPLSQKGYDCYLYQNLTKYILNDDCTLIEFKPNFLISFFKYYVELREKNILSEIVFHLNINTLLEDTLIQSAIKQFQLINPLMFIQIKTLVNGNIDYFQPIKYMYDLFHTDFIKEKKGTLFDTESDKAIKEEYRKMIVENDMKYYNENISIYHEYLAHKILWYCNKCLNKEEYHTNLQMSDTNFKKITKKIIFFLTRGEVMKEFFEFDSYSYFQIISRFYLEKEIFDLLKREIENKEDLFKDIKDFISVYSNGKINSIVLSEKYFFYDLQYAVEKSDNIFIKYDFYSMVTLIGKENKDFILDKYSIKNTMKFFINFIPELEKQKYSDTFNCHKKFSQLKEIKKIKKEVQNNLELMLKLFDNDEEIIIDDMIEILKVPNIVYYRQIRMHLLESSHQYEEYFELCKQKLEENVPNNLEENSNISKVEKIKIFFDWIDNILTKTFSSDKEEHKKFKDFLLLNFNYLSDLSLKDLSFLAEKWYQGEEESIILALKYSQSQALQFKYINYYFATHECESDNIKEGDTYYQYLLLKINLLIKAGYKEQILNLLHHNTFLCTAKLAEKLYNQKVFDACVFIYYLLEDYDKGIKLANGQIKIILNNIYEEINSNSYLSTNIESMLYNFKKYIELAVGICQKVKIPEIDVTKIPKDADEKTEEKIREKLRVINEKKVANEYWFIVINSIYSFQLEFLKKFEENRNNYKTNDYNKINNALDEAFELFLTKMSEYINLKLIINEMSKKFGSAGFERFKSITSLMFIEFKTSENINKILYNLLAKESEKQLNEFVYQFNQGQLAIFEKCETCGKSYDKNTYLLDIIYFKCNHSYHNLCFMKGGYDLEICPICDKTKIDLSKYEEPIKEEKDKNEIQEPKKIEVKKKEVNKEQIKKLEKKIEEQKRFTLGKQKLSQLRRIRKMKADYKIIFDKEFLV